MKQLSVETAKASGLQFSRTTRKYRRAMVPGFLGDIAAGKQAIGGHVEDISTGGFKITNIPNWFRAEKHTYTVILSSKGRYFRLLAKPCWEKKGEQGGVEMGFKILDAPWEWVAFTMHEIPEFDYDNDFGFQA